MPFSTDSSASGPLFFVSFSSNPFYFVGGRLSGLTARLVSNEVTDSKANQWREYEEPYGFLSQWYPSTFTAPSPSSTGTVTFFTAEQYM